LLIVLAEKVDKMFRILIFALLLSTVNGVNLPTPFVEAYWESWNSIDSIPTIVGMETNVITVAFGTFVSLGNNQFNITGLDCTTEQLRQLIDLAHYNGKKVKQSIGGATYGLSGFLTSPEAADGMAYAVATFVELNGLDGVDFDIEDYPPANLQIDLINAVRHFLPEYLISYTPKSPASTTDPYAEVIQGAWKNLTSISIMCYDAYPGYSYQSDVEALISMGVDPSKIVVGLMPGMDDVGHFTNLTDIVVAAKFAVNNNLGGIMLWDLNRDHENETGLGVNAATDASYGIIN